VALLAVAARLADLEGEEILGGQRPHEFGESLGPEHGRQSGVGKGLAVQECGCVVGDRLQPLGIEVGHAWNSGRVR
jgi:hypothetical protein